MTNSASTGAAGGHTAVPTTQSSNAEFRISDDAVIHATTHVRSMSFDGSGSSAVITADMLYQMFNATVTAQTSATSVNLIQLDFIRELKELMEKLKQNAVKDHGKYTETVEAYGVMNYTAHQQAQTALNPHYNQDEKSFLENLIKDTTTVLAASGPLSAAEAALENDDAAAKLTKLYYNESYKPYGYSFDASVSEEHKALVVKTILGLLMLAKDPLHAAHRRCGSGGSDGSSLSISPPVAYKIDGAGCVPKNSESESVFSPGIVAETGGSSPAYNPFLSADDIGLEQTAEGEVVGGSSVDLVPNFHRVRHLLQAQRSRWNSFVVGGEIEKRSASEVLAGSSMKSSGSSQTSRTGASVKPFPGVNWRTSMSGIAPQAAVEATLSSSSLPSALAKPKDHVEAAARNSVDSISSSSTQPYNPDSRSSLRSLQGSNGLLSAKAADSLSNIQQKNSPIPIQFVNMQNMHILQCLSCKKWMGIHGRLLLDIQSLPRPVHHRWHLRAARSDQRRAVTRRV